MSGDAGETVYQNGALRIRAPSPDTLVVEARSDPGVLWISRVGAPLLGLLAWILWRSAHDALAPEGLAAITLGAVVAVFVYAATYRLRVDIDRYQARRTVWRCGLSWSQSIAYRPETPPRVEIEEHVSSSDEGTYRTYEVILRGLRGRLGLGQQRASLLAAQRDAQELMRFFDQRDLPTAGVAASARDPGGWTRALAPAQASGNCPLCRERLTGDEALVACGECATGFHRACADELGGCSTLGCGRQRRQRERA